MDSIINNIVSIFEHFSDTINSEKTNFKSPSTWDDICISISRFERINSILNNPDLLEKKPISFPIKSSSSSLISVNEKILGYKVLDVISIDFLNFYPNIILRLCEEGVLELDKNLSMFCFLFKNFYTIKPLLSEDARCALRGFVNYFYGKLDKDKRELVAGRGYLISEHFSKYPNFLYVNTDLIFIKDDIGIIEKIKEDMNILDIPYDIEYMKEILVISKGRVVTIDSNSIGKINGVKVLKI